MIRGYAVSLMVLAACLASHEASAKPARGKSHKAAAHRTVPTPKPKPDFSTARSTPSAEARSAGSADTQAPRIVVASYVPIGGSKKLPRGFDGPRQAPNRTVITAAAGAAAQMASLSPAQAQAVPADIPQPAPAPEQTSEPVADTATRTLEGHTAKNQFAQAQTAQAPAPPPALSAQPVSVTGTKVAAAAETPAPAPARAAETPTAQSSSSPTGGQTQVGEAPDKSKEVNISVLADRGGVLTPRGTLVVNTGFDYTHTSVSRFFFDGIELADAFLVGEFNFDDIDRNTVSESVGLQYGLTRRLAMSVGGTAMARSDRQVNTALATGDPARVLENDGNGFGDVDFGFQYQINRPSSGWAYYVANLRFKSDTGKGPFDVNRNLQTGLETELPTGSGFWSMEPSLTVIWPSDPAVLYANIGYRWNMERDINQVVKDQFKDIPTVGRTKRTVLFVHDVDPGDSISASMGMGFGLNDQISLSLGYSHSWVFGTRSWQTETAYDLPGAATIYSSATPIDPTTCIAVQVPNPTPPPDTIDKLDSSGKKVCATTESNGRGASAQVGSLQLGTSVNVNQHYGFNVNLSIGVTSDAPDVTVGIRVPFTYRLAK